MEPADLSALRRWNAPDLVARPAPGDYRRLQIPSLARGWVPRTAPWIFAALVMASLAWAALTGIGEDIPALVAPRRN